MTSTKKHEYIAIDIAKDSLQVQSAERSIHLVYDAGGLKKLRSFIGSDPETMVICEATGGYERELMNFLFKKQIKVALVNPARVRAFARSEGLKAKTDPIDARMILRFAEEKRPTASKPPEPEEEELAALVDRRCHLTEQIAREKNRLQNSPKSIKSSIEKMVRYAEKELKSIESRIRKLIDSAQKMKEQSATMQQVCGVGENTAWSILAYLNEITEVNRNEIVALAGVAPFNQDSGTKKGKRKIQEGRAKVRKTLYMAARTAANHNPVIKPYVDGLRARGKPYNCAIVAAMRKILIHLQSLLKKQEKCLA